jgi:dipeptidyl-peptidase-4
VAARRRHGEERLVADPRALLGGAGDDEDLSAEERARRERNRESAGGIVGYALDRAAGLAAFALSSRLFVADTATGDVRELATTTPVIDPRPDPTGARVAYVAGGALRIVESDGTDDRALAPRAGRTPPGVSRSSSPPRRWSAFAATGGRRTAPDCSPRTSTSRR